MNFKKRENKQDLTIDIAPLVDIVFLLLIFFMLSTSFELHPGLKVNLPETSTKEVKKEPESLKVVLTKTGTIYLNGKKVNVKTLQKKFATVKNKKTLVVIEADKFSYHGTVVSIMDIAKQNGLSNFAIATKQKK